MASANRDAPDANGLGAALGQAGRFLITHNPFYLLSVAFVLHSTRLWLDARSWPYNPWPLMGVIGGYILLVAVVGFLVVRWGKVWDDARSIFFILLLLFVELSLTFDPVLFDRPGTGITLLLIGLGLSIGVSEGLLLGLKIRLPVLFRVPYYLMLALLFLYPPAIVAVYRSGTEMAVWRILMFSPLSAGVLLTLLPAVRRGPRYVGENGTPWIWPWFPWSLFAFLGMCLCVRTYALSLSFDSVLSQSPVEAMRLESAFAPYVLVPILLAAGVLILEAGVVSRLPKVQRLGLLVPFAGLLLALPGLAVSAPAREFLARFTAAMGSPLWLTVLATAAFYSYAWSRHVRFAFEGLAASVVLAAIVDPQTISISTLSLQTAPLWIVSISLFVAGVRYWRSWELFLSATIAVVALRTGLLAEFPPPLREGLSAHLLGLVVFGLGAVFHDRFAIWLRASVAPLVVIAAVMAVAGPPEWLAAFPAWFLTAYLAALLGAALLFAYGLHDPWSFAAGIAVGLIAAGRWLQELTRELQREFGWEGAWSFVLGLVFLCIAVAISGAKAGLSRKLAWIVPRAARKPGSRPSE